MILARKTAVALATTFALLAAGPAISAQRTFVSTKGVNNPGCSATAPCRDFASALPATNVGGEIIVLDSGGYGAVTITQAVSIIAAPGIYAGVSVFSGDGVTIAAGPSDKVTLSGLTINGQGGDNGIRVTSGGEVNIERCTISAMASTGMLINGGAQVNIGNCTLRGNNIALRVGYLAALSQVQVVDSRFFGNASGPFPPESILIEGGSFNASRTAITDNGGVGLSVSSPAFSSISVTLTDCVVSGNGDSGVYVNPQISGSTVGLAIVRSTISDNAASGVTAAGGQGTAFVTVSESAVLKNGLDGVSGSTNAASIMVVTGSTIAGNVGADLHQVAPVVLRSSGNNTLTGRGAADIVGSITSNPLK